MHLAQVNVARAKAAMDDDVMAGFVARVAEINALADGSPGFVWRLATDAGVYVRPYDDDRILFNLSVWQSVEALHDFVYRSTHAQLFKQRFDWFDRFERPSMALWWVAEGHIPSIDEAKQRLADLQAHGPTPAAFTFKQIFPAL